MSVLTNKDLHTPFSSLTATRVKGHIEKGWSEQATAADATLALTRLAPVTQKSKITSAYFLSAVVAGANESMTIDLQVNGASILLSGTPLTFDHAGTHTAIGTQIPLPVDPAKTLLNPGDIVTCIRDYTAGGTATPMTYTTVVVEAS